MNYLKERNKGYWFIGITLAFLLAPFIFFIPSAFAVEPDVTIGYGNGNSVQSVFSGKGTRFSLSNTLSVCSLKFAGYTEATTTDELLLRIRTDGTHLDSGTVLATATTTWNGIPHSGYNDLTVTLPSCLTLSASQFYWLQITGESVYLNNKLRVGTQAGTTYENVNSGYNTSADWAIYTRFFGTVSTTEGSNISIKQPVSGIYEAPYTTRVEVVVNAIDPLVTGVLQLYVVGDNGVPVITDMGSVYSGTYSKNYTFDFTSGTSTLERVGLTATYKQLDYPTSTAALKIISLVRDTGQTDLGQLVSSTYDAWGLTSSTSACETAILSGSGIQCALTNFAIAMLKPNPASTKFLKNQFLKIEDVFPFSYAFDTIDLARSQLRTFQNTATTSPLTYTVGSISINMAPSSTIQARVGAAAKNQLFELEKYFAWFSVFLGAFAVVKSKA